MPRVLAYGETDEISVCRTAYGEARGISTTPELHVMWAIRNRCVLDLPFFGGHAPNDVCHRPGQFSCWSLAVWNKANLEAMLDLRQGTEDYVRLADMWRTVCSGQQPDPTNGATYYYAPRGTPQPAWAKAQYDRQTGKLLVPAPKPCLVDADHIYFSIYPSGFMIAEGSIP